jgi:hypothetical protein
MHWRRALLGRACACGARGPLARGRFPRAPSARGVTIASAHPQKLRIANPEKMCARGLDHKPVARGERELAGIVSLMGTCAYAPRLGRLMAETDCATICEIARTGFANAKNGLSGGDMRVKCRKRGLFRLPHLAFLRPSPAYPPA